MKTLLFALMITASSIASADGFVCETEGGITLKVYNHTHPSDGTRNVAILVVSDESLTYGYRTIARFTSANGTLSKDHNIYTANVDLRFNDSSRKGEWIAGTKLGELSKITLNIGHHYGRHMLEGETALGQVSYRKRDGQLILDSGVCTRYLKN